jgi:hypothetical protein
MLQVSGEYTGVVKYRSETMKRFELYCDGCGFWRGFTIGKDVICPECKTDRYLTDNEPRRSAGMAEYYGGEMDCISDADPGL